MSRNDENDMKLAQLLRHIEESGSHVDSVAFPSSSSSISSPASLSESDRHDLDRAQKALALLRRCHEPEDRGDTNRNEATENNPDLPSWVDETPFEIPRQIGRFRIVRELGRGGFAFVLLAHDPNLNRPVALKIPKPQTLFSAESRERFLREARLAAMLSHPAIVPVFESGQIGPLAFIASAYCSGSTLSQWFADQQRSIDPRLAAQIVARLAEAVQHAHSRNVIHRDLKPGNILLDVESTGSETDSIGIVAALRISDFGLAKLVLDDSELSRSDALIGTPAYMSPEQAAGQVDQIGPAADVYALGAILYELLSGNPPHRKQSYISTLRAIENDDPIGLRRGNKNIAADLEAICFKCLEKSPQNRFGSALELEQDLNRFLEGHTIRARPATKLEKLTRWTRRNPAIAMLATLAFISLTIGCGIASWQWLRAERNLVEAISQRGRGDRHLSRLENSIDRIIGDVTRFLNEVPQSEGLRRDLLSEVLTLQQQLVTEESDDPLVNFRTGQAWRRMAESYYLLGEFNSAADAFRNADAMLSLLKVDDIGPQLLSELALIHVKFSATHCAQGESDLAIQESSLAIAKWEEYQQHEPGPQAMAELAAAYRQLAVSYEMAGEVSQAGKTFQYAVDLLTARDINDQSLPVEVREELEVCLAKCLNSLAIYEKSSGRTEQAEQYYEQCIELLQAVIDRHPSRIDLKSQLALTAVNLGNLAFGKQNYEDSAKWYSLAVDLSTDLIADFPNTFRYQETHLFACTGLGIAQKNLNQIDEAIVTMQRGIDLTERNVDAFGSIPSILSNLAKLYGNLANIQIDVKKDVVAGEEAIRKAKSINESLVSQFPDRPDYRLSCSITTGRLASLLSMRGESADGLKLFDVALEDGYRALESNPKDSRYVNNVAWNLSAHSQAFARIGDDAHAIASAMEISKRDPGNEMFWIKSAQALAWCINDIRQDEESSKTEPESCREYVRSLIECLNEAGELRPQDFATLFASPPFLQIKDIPELTEFAIR